MPQPREGKSCPLQEKCIREHAEKRSPALIMFARALTLRCGSEVGGNMPSYLEWSNSEEGSSEYLTLWFSNGLFEEVLNKTGNSVDRNLAT